MSGGYACICKRRYAADFRAKFWRIVQFMCNHSAFNGYHKTSSDYSSLRCLNCGRYWRTKANYVYTLRQANDKEKVAVPLHAEE